MYAKPHPNWIYTFDTPRIQNMDLPDKLIAYIAAQTSKPQVWNKLVKTCKYFFAVNRTVVVEHLVIDNSDAYVYQNRQITKNGQMDCFKVNLNEADIKVWLTGALILQNSFDPKAASKLIRKVVCCDLNRLNLTGQHLNINEFKFLARSKTIQHLYFKDCEIRSTPKDLAPLEMLLENLPNLVDFSFVSVFPILSHATSKKLWKLLRFKKLKTFTCHPINEILEPEFFLKFAKKNRIREWNLQYTKQTSKDYKEKFEAEVLSLLNQWRGALKPEFRINDPLTNITKIFK